jgi:hypothetical protein
MFPKGFSKYVSYLRVQGLRPDQKLARFATRYKVAGQLQSVEFLSVSAKNSEIYTIVFRIGLGFSALESLESRTGKHSISLISKNLAPKLKTSTFLKFREFCLEESESRLTGRLEKLFSSRNDSNLRPIVEVLRNTMFHGQFSPNASGLSTKTQVEFLRELEFLLFKAMDTKSEQVFRKLMAHDA